MPYSVYIASCPTREVLDRIADKWTSLIVGLLAPRPQRFSELKSQTGGISSRMLSSTLRGLESDGLVDRVVYGTLPPKVVYSLTPLGHTLEEVLGGLRNWAEAHIEEIGAARAAYAERDDDATPWQRPTALPES
jgi:DNA-binding HxlR family transcriptional regulator